MRYRKAKTVRCRAIVLSGKSGIENAGDSTNGRAMSNYTVTDTLPNGYKYVTGQTYTNSRNITYPDSLNDADSVEAVK